jgi:inhibitor of KinA
MKKGLRSRLLARLSDDKPLCHENPMEIVRYGEDGIRLVFGKGIDFEIHERVRQWYYFVASLDLKGVIDVIPSFRSCLIRFDPEVVSFRTLSAMLAGREGDVDGAEVPPPVTREIPMAYGGAHGPDMDFVCSYSGLTREEVVEIHTSVTYTVFAVGFMPGFPYMGILDRRLYVPRLDTPRLRVPEGSVGLAQLQTGIYPFESPAGWRIIGRTDRTLFDYRAAPYSALHIGDTVRFVSI